MSVFVNGVFALTCSYAPINRTQLSPAYAATLGPYRPLSLVTVHVGRHGSFSFSLSCDVLAGTPTAIVLGRDWGAFLRESLLAANYRLDRTFDPWQFLSPPDHPLSSPPFPPLMPPAPTFEFVENIPARFAQHAAGGPPAANPPCHPPAGARQLLNIGALARSRNTSALPLPFIVCTRVEPRQRRAGGPSKVKLYSPAPSATDLMGCLTSKIPDTNVFTASRPALERMLRVHHLQPYTDMSVASLRDSILIHLLSGAQKGMAFAALSILLAASPESFPDRHVEKTGLCLGASHADSLSRTKCYAFLSGRRSQIVAEHSSNNPATAIFDNLERVSKGALQSLVQAHGIQHFGARSSKEDLRVLLITHLGSGSCASHESTPSHLSCASLISQFDLFTAQSESSVEDINTVLQIQLLRRIYTILPNSALKRLLDLHDVFYAATDKSKELRYRMKRFLYRLRAGKQLDDNPTLFNGAAKEPRAKECQRLRAEWPQVVPDHLKRRILRLFNLEISEKNQATFSIVPSVRLHLHEFNFELLKRPDTFPPGMTTSADPDSEDLDEEDSSNSELDDAQPNGASPSSMHPDADVSPDSVEMDVDGEDTDPSGEDPDFDEKGMPVDPRPYWLHADYPEPPMPCKDYCTISTKCSWGVTCDLKCSKSKCSNSLFGRYSGVAGAKNSHFETEKLKNLDPESPKPVTFLKSVQFGPRCDQ
ncbi:hypothetical protein C8R43DRAFT_1144248 [Mycena crocata]|nr:hypothetical protein C8R43DRAFT_1144248 [Mycena crocata]